MNSTDIFLCRLGFNSTIDLSNNSEEKASQKSYFTDDAWKYLKEKFYIKADGPKIPVDVEEDLKEIEE